MIEKKELRENMRNALLGITPEQRHDKSSAACRKLIATDDFQSAQVVMLFLSMAHEIDTTEAILAAWQMDKTVVVPKVSWEQRHMIPVIINTLDTDFSLESGVRNPVNGAPMPFAELDLIVTPGLAFDKNGNRLGRGGGYYDRFFAHNSLRGRKCGFGFAEQLLASVPATEHDQSIDMLVTDEHVLNF
jgi:5-formyltetrahydrofolate cyclo-ligase